MKQDRVVRTFGQVAKGARIPAARPGARPFLVAQPVAKAKVCAVPQEDEDAKLTGMTRSLTRRLLGLNVGGSLLPGKMA